MVSHNKYFVSCLSLLWCGVWRVVLTRVAYANKTHPILGPQLTKAKAETSSSFLGCTPDLTCTAFWGPNGGSKRRGKSLSVVL